MTNRDSTNPAVTAPQTTALHWVDCSGKAGPAGYQCATVPVPRDPTKPGSPTISMAVDRRPATGRRIGSLLINPGGPGASGVDFLPEAISFLPVAVLDRFDIVGFDPPGVGRTAPITCLDNAGLSSYFDSDPDPTTPAGLQSMITLDRSYAAGCESQSASELPYVSTVDAAIDMDHLRQALGDDKLTYLGFSYGTFLGATYAGLFPDRVRAMALDGAIDPNLPALKGSIEQAEAFEANLEDLLASCESQASCPWKPGADPLSAYQALQRRVAAAPLPARGTSRTAGSAALLYATAAGLYSTQYWTLLEQALAQAEKGDGTGLLALFDLYTTRDPNGGYTNEFEANSAVNCLDDPVPPASGIEAAATAAASKAPVFGAPVVLGLLQCTVWPVAPTGSPHAISARGAAPIVVVGSTGDPATPYSEAQALTAELGDAVLVTRVGDGHTAYPYSSCVRSAVDSYLINLTVPAEGLRCSS